MSLISTIDKYRKRIKIIKQSNIYSLVFIFVIFIALVIILVLMFDQIMPMKDSDIKKCETQIYNIHKKAYETPGKGGAPKFILFDSKAGFSFYIGFNIDMSHDEIIEKLNNIQNKTITIAYTEKTRFILTTDVDFYDKYEVIYIEHNGDVIIGDIDSHKKVSISEILPLAVISIIVLSFFPLFFILAVIAIRYNKTKANSITAIKIIEEKDDGSYIILKNVESDKIIELYGELNKTKDYFGDDESHEEIDAQMEKYSQYGKAFKPKRRGFLIEYPDDEYDVIYAYEEKEYRKRNNELMESSSIVDRIDSKFNAVIKKYYQ